MVKDLHECLGSMFVNLKKRLWFASKRSHSITQSTGVPQGCVLSPLVFTLLLRHDFTTVVDLISNDDDDTSYRALVEWLMRSYGDNNIQIPCQENSAEDAFPQKNEV